MRSFGYAAIPVQLWQWRAGRNCANGRPSAKATAHFRLIDGAQPGQRLAQVVVGDLRQARGDAGGRRRDRAAAAAWRGSRRRSGAWRSAMRPTACQPKKRLTRSRITADSAGFRSPPGLRPAAPAWPAPARRSSSIGARPLIFIGSLWAAISGADDVGPAGDDFGRGEALRLKASLKVAPRNSESGRGKLREGLFIDDMRLSCQIVGAHEP